MQEVAQTHAKKERARKRFQDKKTRKALVAFVASGTHREIVVKKSDKDKNGMCVINICIHSALCMYCQKSR